MTGRDLDNVTERINAKELRGEVIYNKRAYTIAALYTEVQTRQYSA